MMRPGIPLACLASLSLVACDQLLPKGPEGPAPPLVVDSTPAPAPAPRARPARRPPRPPPDTMKAVTERAAFDQVRRALRRLAAAEQGFYAENGGYTEDLDRIGYQSEGRAKVEFIWLRRDGWAASGSHPSLAGRNCVIYVGRLAKVAPATVRYRRYAKEGIPACDDGGAPTRSSGGSPPGPVTPADTVSELDAVSPLVQMRVDLRNLVLSQNAYLATQGIYSRRVEPLALQYLWRPGVTIILLSADDRSWSAIAKHATLPGRSCVIWYGPSPYRPTTEAQAKRGRESGVPVCDE